MNALNTLADRGIHLAANLSLMYPDLPFMQRFEACARDGFTGVEILFPYDVPAIDIAVALQRNGLELVLINTPPGSLAKGDRGLLGLPGREAEFREALERAISVAQQTACKRIHLMMGVRDVGEPAEGALDRRRGVVLDNLRHASTELSRARLQGLIEPINTRDIPRYLLNTQQQACELLDALGDGPISLQMDLYHCQIVEGDVVTRLRRHFDRIGHIQIAGVPERCEPWPSELDHGHLFGVLKEVGYAGWIGCEYRPAEETSGGTSRGLDWIPRVLR